ncbi:beta-propeller fold lactonase family protein [Granulicella sp. L46]|jgi:6-phosphogluconolactonase|uniref:lactonase family protein n=1 Tax=Granulicella sp. L46 TaxID=1641865 RepID=UPI00131C0BDF|nr:beta-propeller fold lactonase family protein [Granulicella sp. L46]
MKFNTISRIAMAAVVSVAIAFGTTACIRDYTSDYVYAVSNSNGQISAYAVDFQSGVLTQISGSPFSTNLTNPSTVIAAPNGKTIYVIGGSQQAQVQAMPVGSDGKLYGGTGANMPSGGTYPTAAAIDSTGTYLYVTYTYQNGFGPNAPGPGGVAIFPINSDGSLGTPSNVNVGNDPVAIAASAPTCTATPALGGGGTPNCVILGSGSSTDNGINQSFVYVADAEVASAQATILGFVENPGTGALTPITGTNPKNGFGAGVSPSAIAIDPTGKYVYVTDKAQNQVYGYGISNTTSGALTGLVTSPFATGQFPVAITIEPRGKYVYVANYNSQTVSSYSLNLSNGALGASAGSNFTTATGPTCVTVEPALGIYLYTSNFLDATISGGQLSPNTGALSAVATSFFPAVTQPICVVSVPNGPHASQSTQP